MTTSVVIADDHTVVRSSICVMLQSNEEIEVIGECSDGLEAVRIVRKLVPDVVVMDTAMPNMNGIEATRIIAAKYSQVSVVALSAHDDDVTVTSAFSAGAKGYLLKSCSADELLTAIDMVKQGKMYVSPDITHVLVNHIAGSKDGAGTELSGTLTSKERVVLQQLAEGMSARQSSELLDISEKTIGTHRDNIKKKLKISSIAGLTKFAIKSNIVSL